MSVFCFEDIEIFPVGLTDGVRGGVHDVNLNSEQSMLDTRGCLRVRVMKNSLTDHSVINIQRILTKILNF